MKVLDRYVFRRLLGALAIALPALTVSIWLTQALSDINLITDRGQSFVVFLEAAVLRLPSLLPLILPITMLVVVISTVNWLNSDSELVSVEASGASRTVLLRPILMLALPVALLSAACSLYLAPAAERAGASLIEEINANVITSLIRPGQFQNLSDDVVMQAAAIHPDGTLEGLFVFDRQDNETVAYIAEAGALVDNDRGQFLLMQNGVIQRRPAGADAVSTIQFRSYAFDLSTLGPQSAAGGLRPNQRPVDYLLKPDPSDPIFQENPYRYTAELHNRIALPLYVVALSLLPLPLLGSARNARESRGWPTAFAGLAGVVLLVVGISLHGVLWGNPATLPLTYGVPLGVAALCILQVWSGLRLPPPRLRRPYRAVRAGSG
jgi:lipopolysaccharide export system permease protein